MNSPHKLVRRSVFAASLLPLIWLGLAAVTWGLGANPIEKVQQRTGDWALNFLMVTLALSPLKNVLPWEWLGRLRRMTGLFAFFYASLHLINYLALDQFFSWGAILKDLVEHKRIIVGLASYLLLVPLAVTSSDRMWERLGASRWKALHRLAYAAAAGGVVHYLWLVKKDLRAPLVYAGILAALFAFRLVLRLLSVKGEA